MNVLGSHGIARAFAATACTLLAVAWATAAQSGSHVLTLDDSSVDVLSRPTLEALRVDYDLGPPDPVTQGAYCGTATITSDNDNRLFIFDEGRSETGCAEALLDITVPSGAARLTVSFVADRNVSQDGPAVIAYSMRQDFHIEDETGTRFLAQEYYDAAEGVQPPTNFTFELVLPPGVPTISLVWHFEDEGAQAGIDQRASSFQGFDATISNISLVWSAVPIGTPTVTPTEEDEDHDTLIGTVHHLVNVTVPPWAFDQIDSTIMTLRLRSGPELVNVTGPKGPISPEQYGVEVDEGRESIVVVNDTMAEQGPGDYVFDFMTRRTLAPDPPGAAPTRIYWLYYILLAAPLVGAVLATQHSVQYAKEAHGRYVRNARVVLATVVFVIAYYALVALYSFFVVGRHEMSTLPLSPAAVLIDFQLILAAIILVLAAFTGTRLLTRNMRRDLAERQKQTEMLRRSNEELERFAYVASHDLQEPLRKVAGFTALLQRRYKGRLDKDADEMIDYAVDGATRMQALIRDILAYSRINSSQLDLQVVDVGALMALVASDLEGLIQSNHASLSWKGLPTVRADPGQLRQVLQNLVENGIKYRHATRKPRIDISASGDGDTWTFRVADNGVGIPADKATEVFGIFRRLHGRDVPGTGIGLAIVKKALERHGGGIRVAPRRGGGAVFIFTLPSG